jgi:hypothetical protein
VNRLQQRLVVHQADKEHDQQAGADPVHLLDVRTGEFRVERGAVNLHHAQQADEQHERKEDPVKVAVADVASHVSC